LRQTLGRKGKWFFFQKTLIGNLIKVTYPTLPKFHYIVLLKFELLRQVVKNKNGIWEIYQKIEKNCWFYDYEIR